MTSASGKKEHSASSRRKAAFVDLRRELIRNAARRVFVEAGLKKASVREIAKAAGCTTGAIYAQYASKEEVYAEILRESLAELTKAVQEAIDQAKPKARVSAALDAWISYYLERPAEFDLGFYLGNGSQPIGVGTRLNGELNALLRRAYGIVANAMEADGAADPSNKHERAVAFVSWIFGILLMDKTGRLKTARLNSAHLMKVCAAAIGKLDETSPPSRRK